MSFFLLLLLLIDIAMRPRARPALLRARKLILQTRSTTRTSTGKIQIEPLSLQYFLIISIVILIVMFINIIAMRLCARPALLRARQFRFAARGTARTSAGKI